MSLVTGFIAKRYNSYYTKTPDFQLIKGKPTIEHKQGQNRKTRTKENLDKTVRIWHNVQILHPAGEIIHAKYTCNKLNNEVTKLIVKFQDEKGKLIVSNCNTIEKSLQAKYLAKERTEAELDHYFKLTGVIAILIQDMLREENNKAPPVATFPSNTPPSVAVFTNSTTFWGNHIDNFPAGC